MKYLVLLGCLLFYSKTNAQDAWIGQLNSGLNRIGVFYDVGAGYQFNRNRLEFGLRFYQPDLVFEKEYPGLSLSYDYAFYLSKVNAVRIGLAMDAFTEQKGIYRLWLYNPRLFIRGDRHLGNRLILNLKLNSGLVINQLTGDNPPEQKLFTYINYEVSLGLIYRFGTGFDN